MCTAALNRRTLYIANTQTHNTHTQTHTDRQTDSCALKSCPPHTSYNDVCTATLKSHVTPSDDDDDDDDDVDEVGARTR